MADKAKIHSALEELYDQGFHEGYAKGYDDALNTVRQQAERARSTAPTSTRRSGMRSIGARRNRIAPEHVDQVALLILEDIKVHETSQRGVRMEDIATRLGYARADDLRPAREKLEAEGLIVKEGTRRYTFYRLAKKKNKGRAAS